MAIEIKRSIHNQEKISRFRLENPNYYPHLLHGSFDFQK